MPLTLTRTFRVRYSDCNAYGLLDSAGYLRYMQEAAFDASNAAGYDQQRYDEIQRVWLIRESQVEFFSPVHYNEQVAVKTWVADFRRASSRRSYEFSIDSRDELAARGWSDWVFLDTSTNRPTGIPKTVIDDFYPEGAPAEYSRRATYPDPPAQPAGVFRMRRLVGWDDIDSMFHVNNAQYMVYAAECGFQAMAHFGWPWRRILQAGIAIFTRRAWLQYLRPALPDDELEVSTWIYAVHRSSAVRHYQIHRVADGRLEAQVNTLGVWVDTNRFTPIRIPAQMLADLAANIALTVD